jgi:hypothetical protein
MHPAILASRERRKQAEILWIGRACSEILQGKSAKVYLFGSYATGKFSAFSDVDVLIVTEDEAAGRACAAKLPGDTLVVHPSQYVQQKEHTLFWKNIDREKEMISEFG